MKKILVPCDFSKPAASAVRFAIDLAAKSGGSVHLLNVVELPAIYDPLFAPVAGFEKDFFDDLRKKTLDRFQKLVDKYGNPRVTITSGVEFGSPFHVIEEVIRKKKIDQVVMGSHGATGLREYFVGSNAEKVVRRSPVPVLIVKGYPKAPIRNIVFPYGLEGDIQRKLIEKVKDLQEFFKATIHIVYINTPTAFVADNISTTRLKEFAKDAGFRRHTINVYNYPFEEAGILAFTKSIKGDLIVMRTHGRQGLAHFLTGSIAEDVANHAECPIWTFAV